MLQHPHQLNRRDIQGWTQKKLRKECLERDLLQNVPKNGSKYLSCDLKQALVDHIKEISGPEYLMQTQSLKHNRDRDRKRTMGTHKKKPKVAQKVKRTFSGEMKTWKRLNEVRSETSFIDSESYLYNNM